MTEYKVKWEYPARQGTVTVEAQDEDEARGKASDLADSIWADNGAYCAVVKTSVNEKNNKVTTND